MALTDSVALMGSQYAFDGKGPFDAKMLVSSFSDLINQDTWKNSNGESLAYNGMFVAVWKEQGEDAYKNGVYYLHNGAKNNRDLPSTDPNKASLALTNPDNWHKLAELSDLANFTTRLSTLESTLNGNDEVAGLISNVAKNTETIANITSDYAKASELTGEIKAVLTTSLQDYTTAAEFSEIKTKVEENTAKLIGVNTTVTEAIADAIKNLPVVDVTVATLEKLGGIKSAEGANKVSVDAEGTATVQTININSLVQNEGDVLILNGGNDGDPDDIEE